MPTEHITSLQNNKSTYNHHIFGISPEKYVDSDLGSVFTVTSISYTENKQPFVASMESKDFPFWGL